jgi:Prokaryotic Cytochrome C oxidase subunit IV
MPAFLRGRLFAVWAILVAVTLISSQIGGASNAERIGSTRAVTIAVLAIAFAKVWVVMFEFMELRRAPVALRLLASVWVAAVLGGLLAIHAGVFR